MGGQSIVYVHNIRGPFLFMYLQQGLFTRGGLVVKKGQNSVYVVIEWPPNRFLYSEVLTISDLEVTIIVLSPQLPL